MPLNLSDVRKQEVYDILEGAYAKKIGKGSRTIKFDDGTKQEVYTYAGRIKAAAKIIGSENMDCFAKVYESFAEANSKYLTRNSSTKAKIEGFVRSYSANLEERLAETTTSVPPVNETIKETGLENIAYTEQRSFGKTMTAVAALAVGAVTAANTDLPIQMDSNYSGEGITAQVTNYLPEPLGLPANTSTKVRRRKISPADGKPETEKSDEPKYTGYGEAQKDGVKKYFLVIENGREFVETTLDKFKAVTSRWVNTLYRDQAREACERLGNRHVEYDSVKKCFVGLPDQTFCAEPTPVRKKYNVGKMVRTAAAVVGVVGAAYLGLTLNKYLNSGATQSDRGTRAQQVKNETRPKIDAEEMQVKEEILATTEQNNLRRAGSYILVAKGKDYAAPISTNSIAKAESPKDSINTVAQNYSTPQTKTIVKTESPNRKISPKQIVLEQPKPINIETTKHVQTNAVTSTYNVPTPTVTEAIITNDVPVIQARDFDEFAAISSNSLEQKLTPETPKKRGFFGRMFSSVNNFLENKSERMNDSVPNIDATAVFREMADAEKEMEESVSRAFDEYAKKKAAEANNK